jgi:predicted short-subunit dehydrogenase-like oxidoreductase (DUF2520 family)
MPKSRLKLGFIGAGRVGTGLATGLARGGCRIVAVASRRLASTRALARRIPGAAVCGSNQEVVDRADLVFMTVPDDAIGPAVSAVVWRSGTACVHCSGAADLDILGKPVADGALAGGFHPLHMFGERNESPDALRGASVAIAGPDGLLGRLEALARALGARPLRLPAGGRALYHAAAKFSGAFAVALIRETVVLWGRLGVPEKDALRALLPLLRGTVDNVEKLGAAGALGSVIARGDMGTIRKHLAALAGTPESLELYRLLSLRTIPLALEKGTLEPGVAARIEAMLRRPAP